MASRFRHEDREAVPSGWKVRTVKTGSHRVRVAFPPGRRVKGSGRLVSVLHPIGENPCQLKSNNPAELMVIGANPPRRSPYWQMFTPQEQNWLKRLGFGKHSARSEDDVRSMKESIRRILENRQKYGLNPNPRNAGKMVHGLHIEYSPVNQAYFLMWHGSVLRIFQTKAEAKAEMDYLLRNALKENPEKFVCPHCKKEFTAAEVEAGEFRKHMAQHRAGREASTAPRNPAAGARVETYQLTTTTGKPIRKATKVIFADGKEVKFVERLPKRKAIRAALDHLGRNPAELLVMAANPRVEVVHGDNPPVEEIVEQFSGTEAEYIDVYNEPHMARGRYAQLGKLLSLHIKPVKGGQVQKITFGEGADAPVIVTDSSARQMYFVAGNQDISGALESFGASDRGNGLYELGAGRQIRYQGRKEHVADPDEDLWKHDHGEENGVLPTVLFDANNKRLLYEGGDYRIEGPWIRN